MAVHHHRVRNFAAPFLLVLQHDLVDSRTRIVAPVIPTGARHQFTILAPQVEVKGVAHKAMLLDMASVPLKLLADAESSVILHEDSFVAGLDAIFRGYPVGL